MPTYDYECTECGQRFEVFQSITAKPLRRLDRGCVGCGHRAKVRRLIGAGAALLFKGSGFYETDYRSESYKKAAEAEKKNGSDGKAKDSKPDSSTSEAKAKTASAGSSSSTKSSRKKTKD